MRIDQVPWWFRNIAIVGFEDDETDEETDDDSEETEEEESESEEEESEEDDDEEEEEPESAKKDIAGLKSALRKERLARKKAERELRKLQPAKKAPAKKAKAKSEEEQEEEEPSADVKEAAQRNARLAERLKDKAIDAVILKFTADFRDPDDVLRLIDRSEMDVDQDEDDPSEIEVDEESVQEAVKAFAKKKPHLLKSKDQRVGSGSKFGGRSKKSNVPSDEALRSKYPALRR